MIEPKEHPRNNTGKYLIAALLVAALVLTGYFITNKSHTGMSPAKSPKKILGQHITINSQAHHTGKIKIDNSDFEPIEINAGDEKKYDALAKIELIIDSPKDIDLVYNGKPANFSRAQKELHLLLP